MNAPTLSAVPATLPATAAEAPGGTGGPTIMIVEDDVDILLSLTEALHDAMPHARLVPLENARTALTFLHTDRVDLVISDFRMPEMTGLELMTIIHESRPDVPCIMITAYPSTGLTMRAVNEANMAAFFPKPFHAIQLIRKVEQLLAQRSPPGMLQPAP